MKKDKKLTIRQVVHDMNFEILAGDEGLDRQITAEMINRPGIELTNSNNFTDHLRTIVVGVKESNYIMSLDVKQRYDRIENLFKLDPPTIILSANKEVLNVIDLFIELGNKYNIPVLRSNLETTPLMSTMYFYLHGELSKRISVHGVLMDIHGLGTLIIGKSGIGKSETALELIKRGHILVSDDLVEIYESTVGNLVGTAPAILRRYLEIRGIGIVDVLSMFGVGAYKKNKRLSLVVELELWQENKVYDRLGLDDNRVTYFNTSIPKVTIPVLPGRNVSTLVESAAMNQKLKTLGMDAAINFTNAVSRNIYHGDEDDD